MKERYSPLRDITNDAHSKPKLATGVIGIWKTGKSNIRFTPPPSPKWMLCVSERSSSGSELFFVADLFPGNASEIG